MKSLKKRLRKRSVEAYTCACGSPDDCISECDGDFNHLQSGIQTNTDQLARNVM